MSRVEFVTQCLIDAEKYQNDQHVQNQQIKCRAAFNTFEGNEYRKCVSLVANYRSFGLTGQDVIDFFVYNRKVEQKGCVLLVYAQPESFMLTPCPNPSGKIEFYLPEPFSNDYWPKEK